MKPRRIRSPSTRPGAMRAMILRVGQRTRSAPQRGARVESDRRLLLTRDFGLVWYSQMVSQIGDGVSKLALLWFVYSITGSALKTTMIGLLQTIPPILFSPLIGVYVDRLPKKPTLIGTAVLRSLLIGLIPCWVPIDAFTVERLYVLVFFDAIASAFFGPTLTASVPFLVAPHRFTAANALLQSTTSLGIIVGPALSGIGIAALSSQEVLCVNGATYLASAACLVPIRLLHVKRPPVGSNPFISTIRDLVEGLRFAFVEQRTILWLIMTAALYVFGASAFATLFPVFGRKMLGLGPVEVGYLWSALGLGLLLTSIGLVRLTAWNLSQRIQVVATSCAISGAALCGLIWASDRLMAALLMVVIGGGKGALTPINWGILQEITPRHMVGRTFGIYTTGAMASAVTSMIIFGWITQEFGERTSVIGIGLMLLATAMVAAAFSRWTHAHPAMPVLTGMAEGTHAS